MKILKIFSSITLVILLLTSCAEHIDIPAGAWISEDFDIVLYIDPEYRLSANSHYPGIYIQNGEEKKIYMVYDPMKRVMQIFNISKLDLQRNPIGGDGWYYRGGFTLVNDDEFHFMGNHLELNNRVTIVFNRLEEYDPIDPEDWLPDSP